MSEPSATEITEPCPYCGATPEDRDEHVPLLRTSCNREETEYWITCSVCGTTGPTHECEANAIQGWNGSKPDDTISHPCGTLRDAIWEKADGDPKLANTLICAICDDCVEFTRPGDVVMGVHDVASLLIGAEDITPTIARRLEKHLGIPADFWLRRQKEYDEGIAAGKELVR